MSSNQLNAALLSAPNPRGIGRMSLAPDQYRALREMRGSQAEVARYLRVQPNTISRRETGKIVVTHEAVLALLSMKPKVQPTPSVDLTTEMFPETAHQAGGHKP